MPDYLRIEVEDIVDDAMLMHDLLHEAADDIAARPNTSKCYECRSRFAEPCTCGSYEGQIRRLADAIGRVENDVIGSDGVRRDILHLKQEEE